MARVQYGSKRIGKSDTDFLETSLESEDEKSAEKRVLFQKPKRFWICNWYAVLDLSFD